MSARAGITFVNTYRLISPSAPFGGIKDSGYGKEAGIESIKDYTRVKPHGSILLMSPLWILFQSIKLYLNKLNYLLKSIPNNIQFALYKLLAIRGKMKKLTIAALISSEFFIKCFADIKMESF